MDSKVVSGVLIEETHALTLEEFSHATHARKEIIIEMVEYELIHPQGHNPQDWRFDSFALKRAKTAVSFYRDLEVNMSGIALALDLLKQIEDLQQELKIFKKMPLERE